MYTLKIRNYRGEIYELTHNRRQYSVVNVSGLTLPQCDVHISDAGTQDGGEYNSSRLNQRNIVISLVLEGDIESNRQMLYKIFPLHSPLTVYYRTANRDLQIDGYPEAIDGSLFEQREAMQVSIICPDPYWRDALPITGQTTDGTCTMRNRGDVPIGFTAEVRVRTEDEPTITTAQAQSDAPADIRAHDALLAGREFALLDLDATTVNLFMNNVIRDPADYSAEIVTRADNKELWLHFPNGGLVNAQVYLEIIHVDTLNLTDMRYWQSDELYAGSYVSIYGIPSWFDENKDCMIFAYTYGHVGRRVPTGMSTYRNPDGTYQLYVTFATEESGSRIELRLYHSMGGTDVHDATISREITGTWSLGQFSKTIIEPVLPTYDSSKDILRVYKGDTLLEDTEYHFTTITRADSSTMAVFGVTGGGVIDKYITFEVFSSTVGEDIHDYTQEQIDAGMCIVDNLTLTNQTTGGCMAFPGVQFRNGDTFDISTVPGDLRVVVTESSWMPAGTSLVREVLKNGEFFKLEHGVNELTLAAVTNADYVSASFTAQQLFGGV